MPIKVAIVPLPLTPAALFGYGILRFLGRINEATEIRFTRILNPQTIFFSCEERIVDLRVDAGVLHSQVLRLVEPNSLLKRVLSFATFGENQEVHAKLESVLKELNTESSRLALSEISGLVRVFVENGQDAWKSARFIEPLADDLSLLVTRPLTNPYPRVTLPVCIPILEQKGEHTERKAVDSQEVMLELERVFSLQEKHIGIVIGGPPHSSKSSLAVNLVSEMRRWIKFLKKIPGFEKLELTVGYSKVDHGDPAGDAIHGKWANDNERLQNQKQLWNTKLAKIAQRGFFESRAKYNLVVADLPGLVTDITRLLVAPADAGILISRDYQITEQEWVPLMKSFGVPIVSKIRSRQSHEGLQSMVTSWQKGKRLNGRVVGLDRIQIPDLFIQSLALFLLFDILPTQFR